MEKKSAFIIEIIPKYQKCPALGLTGQHYSTQFWQLVSQLSQLEMCVCVCVCVCVCDLLCKKAWPYMVLDTWYWTNIKKDAFQVKHKL